jgi:hypothetical protein
VELTGRGQVPVEEILAAHLRQRLPAGDEHGRGGGAARGGHSVGAAKPEARGAGRDVPEQQGDDERGAGLQAIAGGAGVGQTPLLPGRGVGRGVHRRGGVGGHVAARPVDGGVGGGRGDGRAEIGRVGLGLGGVRLGLGRVRRRGRGVEPHQGVELAGVELGGGVEPHQGVQLRRGTVGRARVGELAVDGFGVLRSGRARIGVVGLVGGGGVVADRPAGAGEAVVAAELRWGQQLGWGAGSDPPQRAPASSENHQHDPRACSVGHSVLPPRAGRRTARPC